MRIDKFLTEKFGSRTKAAEAVNKKLVFVNGKNVSPSYEVKQSDNIEIRKEEVGFVSNGGYKLNKALNDFSLSVNDKVFVDIGASNGGFTDCLLQRGAKKVYCVDVGESQLDKSLLTENIVVIDNFNARNLDDSLFEEEIDGVVIDVSFISLTYILNAVSKVLKDGGIVIALIKPQFECESKKVGKNGIVKDKKQQAKIIEKIYKFAKGCSLVPQEITTAPIVSGKNTEYPILLIKNSQNCADYEYLLKSVKLY